MMFVIEDLPIKQIDILNINLIFETVLVLFNFIGEYVLSYRKLKFFLIIFFSLIIIKNSFAISPSISPIDNLIKSVTQFKIKQKQ
ncbi:MAG: hypothetical protein HQK51_11675 [Oligoflexia bacterium]|nr:hypothetical protein [Oligoflexia bacterium]